mgnify:CR=1 FL=1
MAVDGNEIGILIGTDLIGSQRGVSITRSAEMLDISDKTDDDAKFLAGKRTMGVECGAFYVSGDTAYAALVTAYEAGTSVTMVWSDDANEVAPGTIKTTSAFVQSMSIDGPSHGPAEISISLQATA